MTREHLQSLISILEASSSRYVCVPCKLSVDDFGIPLEIHHVTHHTEFPHVSCPYCSLSVKPTFISQHIDRHFHSPDQLPFICLFCCRGFNKATALLEHVSTFHPAYVRHSFYKCSYCNAPTASAVELSDHLKHNSICLFHCPHPSCIVKSTCRDLVVDHSLRVHGQCSDLLFSKREYRCAYSGELVTEVAQSCGKEKCSLFCGRCPFGTFNLDVFADHLTSCRRSKSVAKQSVFSTTCTLFRCSVCSWTTTSLNMLHEHIDLDHPSASRSDLIQTEEFTVPLADSEYHESPFFEDSDAPTFSLETSVEAGEPSSSPFDNGGARFITTTGNARDPGRASVLVEPRSSATSLIRDFMKPETIREHSSEQTDSIPTHSEQETFIPPFHSTKLDIQCDETTTAKEFVQLYFNEEAFVAAYNKCGKFNTTNRGVQNIPLDTVLQKLRRFAEYKVPILGRANQRRVAGCPECMKPFNHGFTDLKKHLLVIHLDLRKDITRFAIEFTHSASHMIRYKTDSPGLSSLSNLKQHLFTFRSARPANRCFQRKFSSLSVQKRNSPTTILAKPPDCKAPLTPLATVSTDGHPVLVSSSRRSFVGSAPVHRFVPGTGVSARDEDMKSLEEVESETPCGRGGIIPLDENGSPIMAAVIAANLDSNYGVNSETSESFLPKVGRQHIQLAYSYPVFKRLLEIHKVPMTERVQLINRMNYYARQYVIMDILAPGGAQKRFSCPTCMYTSIHSLADIRKHILGSHCGISTKRFRLCLRASRHDATTYRLHTDERMIRFVEEHGRRQAICNAGKKTSSSCSLESDQELRNSSAVFSDKNCDEDLAIKSEFFDQSYPYQTYKETESDHSNASGLGEFNTTPLNGTLDCQSEEISQQPDQVRRVISLPFSANVLQMLLEREGMLHQLDDLLVRMQTYSSHKLTVVSSGNRIHAYICSCGRRFSVVREDSESEIRPASLADCRRHILGVHAKIPQELLTLCCQASRISKESGYRLYSDTSLLALADQHKFRNSRHQHCQDPSPAKSLDINIAAVECKRSPEHGVDSARRQAIQASEFAGPSTSCQSPVSHVPSHVGMGMSSSIPREVEKCEDPSEDPGVSLANTWNMHQETLQSGVGRHSGLDLDAPRRLLTPEEATCWGHILSLPDNWTLERIVRLAYSVKMFENHLRNIIPDNDEFIRTLHDRMLVYTRHSVYIARMNVSTSQSQRIYACCACLTTSMHGLGDVRKHILGVHAHIPERFKTVAMNSSRLNREDYSLQCDPPALPLPNSNSSLSLPSNLSHVDGKASRVLRRRQRSSDLSPVLRSPTSNHQAKKSKYATDSDTTESCDDPNIRSSDHVLNGSVLPETSARPPIILTIPKSKAFCSSASSDKSDSSLPGTSDSDPMPVCESSSTTNFLDVPITGSRSRRSMVLKSKRPCPTTI